MQHPLKAGSCNTLGNTSDRWFFLNGIITPEEEACSLRRAAPKACLSELLRVRSGQVLPAYQNTL
jgi:hypothetical protein